MNSDEHLTLLAAAASRPMSPRTQQRLVRAVFDVGSVEAMLALPGGRAVLYPGSERRWHSLDLLRAAEHRVCWEDLLAGARMLGLPAEHLAIWQKRAAAEAALSG